MASKRVLVFEEGNDEPIMLFNSVKECALYFGVDSSYISYNISGRYKTIKGKKYHCKTVVDNIYHTNITCNFGNKTPRAIDVYGILVDTYDNVKLAANATGITPASIYQFCRGEQKKADERLLLLLQS